MCEVDAHFHIWELDRFKYPWPSADVTPPIYRDITYTELTAALSSANVKNAVFIQCLNGNIEEAKWVLESGHPAIKGVVAGVNLTDHEVLVTQLDVLSTYPRFVGVRHILDMEDTDWILRDDVIAGLKIVSDRGLTFDFLARPHHLKHVATLARALPELRIVIDHIAKPCPGKAVCADWAREMRAAAECPNVYCKISGLVTEVDPEHHNTTWSKDTFTCHVNYVLDVFGSSRCMVGSDWPVLYLTGTDYKTVNQLHKSLLVHLSAADQIGIMGGNAASFYKLIDLD